MATITLAYKTICSFIQLYTASISNGLILKCEFTILINTERGFSLALYKCNQGQLNSTNIS